MAMAGGGDVEARLSRLEHEMDGLRRHAAETRALAALGDRDVADLRSDMRGHREVLNALRGTQLEQDRTLTEHTDTLNSVTSSLERVTGMLTMLIDRDST